MASAIYRLTFILQSLVLEHSTIISPGEMLELIGSGVAEKLRNGRRYLDTIRFLSLDQIRHRLQRTLRRRTGLHGAMAEPVLPLTVRVRPFYPGWTLVMRSGPWSKEWARSVERGAAVAKRQFSFLGQQADLRGKSAPWNDTSFSALWRYHLHYFDYLVDLGAWAQDRENTHNNWRLSCQTFQELVTDWISRNPPAAGDGWHPYTVSVRLVNWMQAAELFAAAVQGTQLHDQLSASLAQQARYLAGNLELDVRGNHLIKNLRALIVCSIFFGGAESERWRKASLTFLHDEVREQILSDGGHFERSPGYHAVVLKDLLETALWLDRSGHPAPDWLRAAIERMLRYLLGIVPPSGQLPLLKDTAWNAIPRPDELFAAGALYLNQPEWKRFEDFPLYAGLLFGEEGYKTFSQWTVNHSAVLPDRYSSVRHLVMRDDAREDYLIFDVGKPSPEYLPAHAHADLLSYELVVDGCRTVVDSGVYEYKSGAWRNYFRSTRAHNTVEVEGQNQSEVWDSFRMGKRARPGQVYWQIDDEFILAQGEHDGYCRLPVPVVHRRTIVWLKYGLWLIVDELSGRGRIEATNYVHLHPAIELEVMEASIWHLLPSSLWVTAFGHHNFSVARGQSEPVRQGWYSEAFGELLQNTVLELQVRTSLPLCWGYSIAKGDPAVLCCSAAEDQQRVHLEHEGRTFSLCLPRHSSPSFQ